MLYTHPFYLIFQELKWLILQQDFIQEPPILRSALLMTDGIFQDGCNNFSQPTCSSYIDLDVLPVKIQGLRYLPLNLSKTATIAEVMPPDFWSQDMKEASASTQFLWDAIFFGTQLPFCEEAQATCRAHVYVFSRLSAPAEIH